MSPSARAAPIPTANLRGPRRLIVALGGVLFDSFISRRVENAPDFSRLGPVILAPNHTSYLDPPLIQWACSLHVTFMMTANIYDLPWTRWFFRFWGAVPVPERGSALPAMRSMLAALREGRPVCVFPEGRVSPDGYLQEGRAGVATLMARAHVPVIPVAIMGAFRVLPKAARFPRPGPLLIRFGEPLDPPESTDREALRTFADSLMEELHRLGAPRRP